MPSIGREIIERFQLEAEGGKLAKRDGGPLSEHTVGMTVGAGGEKEPPQVPEPSHHQSQRAALPVTRGAKFLWAEVAINVPLLNGKHTHKQLLNQLCKGWVLLGMGTGDIDKQREASREANTAV